jgi:hypothetical protein
VHVVNFDRYRLRLHLECPLLGVPEQRRHRAFDQYTAELVRDDGTVCAAAEVYFVRIDDARADHARAAAAIGSEFLVKVCSEALDWRGAVLEDIEAEFMDAMTDVFVLEHIDVLDPDADKPVLREAAAARAREGQTSRSTSSPGRGSHASRTDPPSMRSPGPSSSAA